MRFFLAEVLLDNQLRKHINSIWFKLPTRLINNVTSRAKQSFTRNCRLPVHLLVMGEKSEID